VRCKEALVSPSTGILDSHAIMQFFEGRITANEDSNIVTHTKAVSIGTYFLHKKIYIYIYIFILICLSDRRGCDVGSQERRRVSG
jgi:hypothetical protein